MRTSHFTCFICPELKSVINHSLTDQNSQSWVFWIISLLDPFGQTNDQYIFYTMSYVAADHLVGPPISDTYILFPSG